MATLEQIKKLREMTGAGIVEVKKALEEAGGDESKAAEILKERSREKAGKKIGRIASEGVVVSYVHSNNKVGAMVKLFCETDFVARNEEFKSLASDIAMHIAAASPQYLKVEDAPDGVEAQEDLALLSQPFVKNPEITIGELITEKAGKMGENIQIGEFVRFEL